MNLIPTSGLDVLLEKLGSSLRPVLEVGPGDGEVGTLLRAEGYGHVAGVEAHQAAVDAYSLGSIYHSLKVADLRVFHAWKLYPSVILHDALDHMAKDEGEALLGRLYRARCEIYVTAAIGTRIALTVTYGNPIEEYVTKWLPSDLDKEGFRQVWEGTSNFSETVGLFVRS